MALPPWAINTCRANFGPRGIMSIPKPDFRGLGAVAEATGVWLFLSSEMGAGRISLAAAHQRRGQCNGRLGPVPAARVVPTDAAAPRPPASAARRGASAWGPGGRPRRVSIIAMTWPFVAMLTGDRRPTPPRVVSTAKEPMSPTSCGGASAGSRRGATRGSRKGRPRRLRDGTQTLKKRVRGWTYYIRRRNSALDVFCPTTA